MSRDVLLYNADLRIEVSQFLAAILRCAAAAIASWQAALKCRAASLALFFVTRAIGTTATAVLINVASKSTHQPLCVPSFLSAIQAFKKTPRSVLAIVNCARWKKFQVFRTVVCFDAVSVVNYFARQQLAAKYFLHDDAMLIPPFVVPPDL